MNGRQMVLNPWDISSRDPDAPPWESIEHKDWEAAKMATYAAMIDRMDQGIGKVLKSLRDLGQEDNTLIMFLSDNGGCAEFMAEDGWAKFYPTETHNGIQVTMGNRPDIRPGGADTFQSYDLPWANASNAPFRLFKHWVHEGGISTPLIVQWPDRLKVQGVRHEPSHVVDILPTILEATGSIYPSEMGGHGLQSLDGESLLDALSGKTWQRQQPIYWEHEGNMAIRDGEWKLVKRHGQDWELYQMDEDRTELNDLSLQNFPMVQKLSHQHAAWCESLGVRDWNEVSSILQQLWGMDGVD
jgi:arylsulfatase A-like enzyme